MQKITKSLKKIQEGRIYLQEKDEWNDQRYIIIRIVLQ